MPTPQGSELIIDLVAIGPNGDEVGGDEPLEITLGQGQLPPALEERLRGASIGDVVEVEFAAGEVFGEYDPDAIQSVPRSEFGDEVELVRGGEVSVSVEHDDGEIEELDAKVLEVDEEAVVLDFNHPLAGKIVTLQATVLDPAMLEDEEGD
jgi:FKBP-type peptidyl-prolyl cis-trans isomerase 2